MLLWPSEVACAPDCISLLHPSPYGKRTDRAAVLSVHITEMPSLPCNSHFCVKPGLLILQCWNCPHMFGDITGILLLLWCLLISANDLCND